MPKANDELVTWGELRHVYKKLDRRVTDIFVAVNDLDDKQAGFWDEHEDKIQRHQRALKRHEDRIAALESDD